MIIQSELYLNDIFLTLTRTWHFPTLSPHRHIFRSLACSPEALGSQDLVPDYLWEAAPSLQPWLLEEQQAIPVHPLSYHWCQHSPDGPESLLLQRLRYAQWIHTQRLLHDFSSLWWVHDRYRYKILSTEYNENSKSILGVGWGSFRLKSVQSCLWRTTFQE